MFGSGKNLFGLFGLVGKCSGWWGKWGGCEKVARKINARFKRRGVRISLFPRFAHSLLQLLLNKLKEGF